MLGEYMTKEPQKRTLRDDEKMLVTALVSETDIESYVLSVIDDVLVTEMSDGGMGSLKFCAKSDTPAQFGREFRTGSFLDADGVAVSVALNLDRFGQLYELDVWKGDSSPLIRLPNREDFRLDAD
jgi:hypothetical protein